MRNPVTKLRTEQIQGLETIDVLHEWEEGKAGLYVDIVKYKEKKGVLFYCFNPPVHQMGNPALDAYLAAFDKLRNRLEGLSFLVLDGPADPVHAGGDLKESLKRLEATREKAAELKAKGARPEEIDALYNWADARLKKGFALYEAMRDAGKSLRTIAVCSGGTRFGGSAEVPLMADILVGDSRSAMCFSESQIGLIPGWGGVGRAITKAGAANAKNMAMTCPVVSANDLARVGIYDLVVPINEPLPRMSREGTKEEIKALYIKDLQENNLNTAKKMLPVALDAAVSDDVPKKPERVILKSEKDLRDEVARRQNPETYKHLWGKHLKEVKKELAELGKPLAPQSIVALEELFENTDMKSFDERDFILREVEADARIYRDPRLSEGILATLEQRIANYTEANS